MNFITEASFEEKLQEIPENLAESIWNLSSRLSAQDKYVLASKASQLYQITQNEQFVIGEVSQLLYYIRKSYQNSREYLDVYDRSFIEDKIDEIISGISIGEKKYQKKIFI
jgi:hypothetical protein